MIPKELGIVLIIAAIIIVFLYAKKILIWRDVMLKRNEQIGVDLDKLKDNNYSKHNLSEFESASEPLIKYLCENHHPHVTVIVTSTSIELLESTMCNPKIHKYLVD